MNRRALLSLRALVLAPNGRDAPLTVLLLKEAGFAADICGDHSEPQRRNGAGRRPRDHRRGGRPSADLRPAGSVLGGAAGVVGPADNPADASGRRPRTQSVQPAARRKYSAT